MSIKDPVSQLRRGIFAELTSVYRDKPELLGFVVERCAEFNMTTEEVRRVWPFPVDE
jgi:hypothetical protein